MITNHIRYRAGYKYQLSDDYGIPLYHFPKEVIGDLKHEFICLHDTGQNILLRIKAGYAWDGPSGPTIDTKDFMRGSLVHDVLYQVLRERNLHDHEGLRYLADKELHRLCREDGMSRFRAWYTFWAVRLFGSPCAKYAGKRACLTAP